MGRGMTKAKKLTVTSHGDTGSGKEEKIPTQKRRGRLLKPLKDEIIEDKVSKMEEDDNDDKDPSITDVLENSKKRRRNSPSKEKQSPVKDENDNGVTLVPDVSNKPNQMGFYI
ncbi:uncharacterized protein LOC141637679 [Silene latifolia]|uniref:uncharacterized protein LOC141637679 n=1 Tax=Silene latifolia TaxID=37657 RepID=UPI003D77718E